MRFEGGAVVRFAIQTSIAVVSTLLLCGACRPDSETGPAQSAAVSPNNTPLRPAGEVAQLARLAQAGDLAASEELALYSQERSDQFSYEQRSYWMEVASDNGSDWAMRMYLQTALSQCSRGDPHGREWHARMVSRFGPTEVITRNDELMDKYCPLE
jgi:hypothetical protein